MKKSLIILVAILGMNSSIVFGAFDGGNLVNHVYRTPTLTFVKVEDTMLNPANCISDYWYGISQSDPSHDDYVSIAMTALASGKTLSYYISDTVCMSGYPLITGVIINR